MNYILCFSLLFLLSGCGNIKVDVGSSKHEATVTLGFIDQIQVLCKNLHPLEDFDGNAIEQRKIVAGCTLQKLTDLKLTEGELEEYKDILDVLEEQAGDLELP